MTTRTLYALRTTANGYVMAKFEDGVTFDVVATYTIETDPYSCDCPSQKRPCKHLNMLADMVPNADTDRFYDPKTDSWHTPLSPMDPLLEETEAEAEELAQVLDEEDEALEAAGLNVTVIDENTDKDLSLNDFVDHVKDSGVKVDFVEARPHPALGTIKRRV